jgi:hypothetical protein
MKAKNPTFGGSVASATAPDPKALEQVLQGDPSPESFCIHLAKVFHVRQTEVALMRLEKSLLKFIFPPELATAGSIPISSSAVAANTASTKKVELFNSFAKVKHAGIFETVRLGAAGEGDPSAHAPIQKLMTSPVVDEKNRVMGVLQISRKGFDPASAGADFTLDDLQRLEQASRILAKASFMKA